MNRYLFVFLFLALFIAACERKSPCDGIDCNFGNCVVSPQGIAFCDCNPGYYGDCSYENFDPCLAIDCKNGAECVIKAGNPREAFCQCPPQYTGPTCEQLNPCYDVQCQNGGVCQIDSLGFAQCNCPPQFTGVHCELPNPCYGVTCGAHEICNNGNCNCEQFYERTTNGCTAMRDKYIKPQMRYQGTDDCQHIYNDFVAAGQDIAEVSFSNFYLNNTIKFTVTDSLHLKIAKQNLSGDTTTIRTIANALFYPQTDSLSVRYVVELLDGTDVKVCNAELKVY